jgi:hypothetical protein
MILECIQWRRTVEDVGIEELYRSIDPFDVRSAPSLSRTLSLASFEAYLSDLRRSLLTAQFPGRQCVFESWPMGFHKVRTSPRLRSRNAHTQNQCSASDPSLPFRLIR